MRRTHKILMATALSALCLLSARAQKVEYFWDTDPGVGKGTVLQTFTGNTAKVQADLNAGSLLTGIHLLGLRALNNGHHSATYYRQFYVPAAVEDIKRIEYSWDKDPGVGNGNALSFTAGSVIDLTRSLSASGLKEGIHTLYLRAVSNKHASQTYCRQFYVPAPVESIKRIEYYWDKDPGVGKGYALSFTAGSVIDLTQQLSASGLKEGIHTLYLRAISNKHASQIYTRQFYVPATPHKVEALEYWFDKDPGIGNATRIAATLTGDSLKTAFDVTTDGLEDGVHKIGLRTLTDGTWSETKVRQFLVRSTAENHVTRVEYFWNNDPGAGYGHAVDITPGEEVSIDFEADMTELGEGPHTLGLRAQSGSKGWSPVSFVSGIEFEGWDNLQEYLNSLYDTEDVLTNSQYTRQLLNKDWHALYIPFHLSYSDWSAHFDVARINAFYQYDDDEDGIVDRQVMEAILVKASNGSLMPNHPYLIRAKQTGTFKLNVDPSKRVAEEINSISCSTMEARYTFTGNYSNMTGLKSASKYRLRGTTLSIPEDDDEVLPPYRWYMTIDNLGNQLQQSARRINLRIYGEDGTTLIENVEAQEESTYGFDLQGRKVPRAQMKKGLYIINNKKYVIE